jgi:hypothetical protein
VSLRYPKVLTLAYSPAVLRLVISPSTCNEVSCSLKDGRMVINIADIVSTVENGRNGQPFWRG